MAELQIQGRCKRRIWSAVVLSLVMPGLGQVYCGRLKRGLVLSFLSVLPLPLIIALLALSDSAMLIQTVVALLTAAAVVQLLAILDSVFLANRAETDYQLKDYNSVLVYVLLVLIVTGGCAGSALYLRDQLLEAFRVPQASCYPTILPGDRILANKSAYRSSDPERGDLVVLICPENRHSNYIKRVVALAGETVEIRDGRLYINGQELPQRELPGPALKNLGIEVNRQRLEGDVFEETNGQAHYRIFVGPGPVDQTTNNFAKITVPEHHCFILGDNRNLSRDSRHFGPVHLGLIKGRADYIYFPSQDWSRFGRIR